MTLFQDIPTLVQEADRREEESESDDDAIDDASEEADLKRRYVQLTTQKNDTHDQSTAATAPSRRFRS